MLKWKTQRCSAPGNKSKKGPAARVAIRWTKWCLQTFKRGQKTVIMTVSRSKIGVGRKGFLWSQWRGATRRPCFGSVLPSARWIPWMDLSRSWYLKNEGSRNEEMVSNIVQLRKMQSWIRGVTVNVSRYSGVFNVATPARVRRSLQGIARWMSGFLIGKCRMLGRWGGLIIMRGKLMHAW